MLKILVACMPEGQPQPVPQEVVSQSEVGNSEGFGSLITSLIEQQTNPHNEDELLYNSPAVRVYDLLSDLRYAAPKIWQDTTTNVFMGYGSLVYDNLPVIKQLMFAEDTRNEQEARGRDLVLTEEEGDTLKKLARAVGVEYDPGGAENPEKRTFPLADIEKRTPDRSKISAQMYDMFVKPIQE